MRTFGSHINQPKLGKRQERERCRAGHERKAHIGRRTGGNEVFVRQGEKARFASRAIAVASRSLTRKGAKAAVDKPHAIMVGRELGQNAIVVVHVALAEREMDGRRFAIATGAAAHLVEFGIGKRHCVQHHMTHVGNIDALAERRRAHEHAEHVVAEQLLDAGALFARKTSVVEADLHGDMRRERTKHARDIDRHGARVHIHDGLLTRRDDIRQIRFFVARIAMVIEQQVIAHMGIAHEALHPQAFANLSRHLRRCRCRSGEHRFHPQTARKLAQLGVCIAASAASVG